MILTQSEQSLEEALVAKVGGLGYSRNSNCLSAFERMLAHLDTQITQTQIFKRGLLQQMFV